MTYSKFRSANLAILAVVGVFCLWQTSRAQAALTYKGKVSSQTLIKKNQKTLTSTKSNVFMNYYLDQDTGTMVNFTKSYDSGSQSYLFDRTVGALKLGPLSVWLKLPQREEFVSAFAYYVNPYNTTVYESFDWNGSGDIPVGFHEKGSNGQNYNLLLSSINVQVVDPTRAFPSKGGGK